MNWNAILGAFLALMMMTEASAVSISGRATDDSVCDLGPDTTYRVTRKVFVPAYTEQLPEIYFRLAMRYIVANCRDSQTLVLHSAEGDRTDDRAFQLIAPRLCHVADIQRTTTATKEEPSSFQLRCRITKMREARAGFKQEEDALSTEDLIAKNAPRPRSPAPGQSHEHQERCDEKLTAGQLFYGFGGRCADRSR